MNTIFFKATPHVTGLIAYLIAKEGNLSTSAMRSKIQTLSLKGVLSGIRALPFFLLKPPAFSCGCVILSRRHHQRPGTQ